LGLGDVGAASGALEHSGHREDALGDGGQGAVDQVGERQLVGAGGVGVGVVVAVEVAAAQRRRVRVVAVAGLALVGTRAVPGAVSAGQRQIGGTDRCGEQGGQAVLVVAALERLQADGGLVECRDVHEGGAPDPGSGEPGQHLVHRVGHQDDAVVVGQVALAGRGREGGAEVVEHLALDAADAGGPHLPHQRRVVPGRGHVHAAAGQARGRERRPEDDHFLGFGVVGGDHPLHLEVVHVDGHAQRCLVVEHAHDLGAHLGVVVQVAGTEDG
jgi:hypothetical protein